MSANIRLGYQRGGKDAASQCAANGNPSGKKEKDLDGFGGGNEQRGGREKEGKKNRIEIVAGNDSQKQEKSRRGKRHLLRRNALQEK